MAARGLRSKWLWAFFILLITLFLFLFYSPSNGPKTPMTLGRAEQLFKEVNRPGQSREDVQAWLSSRGILYDVLNRREDTTYKGWWMDVLGHQTVAECAGLNVDDVYSVIRVYYPDARRTWVGHTEITVYWFFDRTGRLLRQWANEFDFGL
jgi:hypothetical protein